MSKKEKQDLFIRICKDSGYTMDSIAVAQLVAKIIKCSPLEIWTAFESLDTMDKIARGLHPVCKA